ncbi:hypothetical protein HN011_007551 [Eciton burchellii]|nr:hypothetical protein HN011_007551 [Eciton burchellii]
MASLRQLRKLSRSFLAVSPVRCSSCSKIERLTLARAASTTQSRPLAEKEEVSITFIKANGERIKAKGKIGENILDIVVNNDIDLDGYGACEGTLSCSTCHLIFPKDVYDSLPTKPSEEELDMLDLAFEPTETSRLGCQIVMSKDLDGLEVRVPATINDARK